MLQTIEKLEQKKKTLTTKFEETKTEFKTQIKQINSAIKNFSKGYKALNKSEEEIPLKRGMALEIERILESGPTHVRDIAAELALRGYSSKIQSVSAILQIQVKTGNKFMKIAPATFGLIPVEARVDLAKEKEQTIVYDDDSQQKAGGKKRK